MHAHTIEWGTARSALCLHAAHPAPGDTPCLVWLQLDGGAVRAFALPLHRCHAATLETLARQCAQDGDGRLLQYALDGASANTTRQVSAQALYAAPVSPGADAASWAVCARWLAWCERHGAAVDSACAGNACAGELPAPPDVQGAPGAALLRWSQGLDGEVVRVLASLGGERVYASCRNYTRLVRGTPTVRRYRLQALERYPNQLAHVLISPHHAYDLHGGRSHAWRLHDAALQSAVDDGGPLLQTLAQACAVDKSVFKTPALRTNWPTLALSRAQTLQVLHGVPPPCAKRWGAHGRPCSSVCAQWTDATLREPGTPSRCSMPRPWRSWTPFKVFFQTICQRRTSGIGSPRKLAVEPVFQFLGVGKLTVAQPYGLT